MEQQVVREFVMMHPDGLHARPAALLVKMATKFGAETSITYQGDTVSAKSILGVLSLAVGPGDKVAIATQGADAAEAMRAIAGLFERSFGEANASPDRTSPRTEPWSRQNDHRGSTVVVCSP